MSLQELVVLKITETTIAMKITLTSPCQSIPTMHISYTKMRGAKSSRNRIKATKNGAYGNTLWTRQDRWHC